MSKVAIIIPMYNCEKYITVMLDCLQKQTFKDWNCFLINDGSTDGTSEVIKPYLKDLRFHYYYKENGGPSSARNLGLDLITEEEYTYMPDADDIIDEHLLQDTVNALDRVAAVNVVAVGVRELGPNDIVRGDIKYPKHSNLTNADLLEFREGYPVLGSAWGYLVRSKVIKDNHLRFNEKLHNFEDFTFTRDVLYYNPTILYLPQIYYIWRQQNINSLTSKFYINGQETGPDEYIKCSKEWIKNHPDCTFLEKVQDSIEWVELNKDPSKTLDKQVWLPAQINFYN